MDKPTVSTAALSMASSVCFHGTCICISLGSVDEGVEEDEASSTRMWLGDKDWTSATAADEEESVMCVLFG